VRLLICHRRFWGQKPGSAGGVHLRHGTSCDRGDSAA
jgi:hypothetical protein